MDEDKLRKACGDFESIFLQQLLHAMRQTIPHGGFLKEGPEKDIFQSLFDQELSKTLAERKGIGLGEMLFRQLKWHGKAQPFDSKGSSPETTKNGLSIPNQEK